MSMDTGGYTEFKNVEGEAKEICEQATTKLAGFSFAPMIVATQVVGNAVNYLFAGNGGAVAPGAIRKPTTVVVHKPTGADPIITLISTM